MNHRKMGAELKKIQRPFKGIYAARYVPKAKKKI